MLLDCMRDICVGLSSSIPLFPDFTSLAAARYTDGDRARARDGGRNAAFGDPRAEADD